MNYFIYIGVLETIRMVLSSAMPDFLTLGTLVVVSPGKAVKLRDKEIVVSRWISFLSKIPSQIKMQH